MCGTPVESWGGVRKVIPKHLLSSSVETERSSAPDFLCLYNVQSAPYSVTTSVEIISNEGWDKAVADSVGASIVLANDVDEGHVVVDDTDLPHDGTAAAADVERWPLPE